MGPMIDEQMAPSLWLLSMLMTVRLLSMLMTVWLRSMLTTASSFSCSVGGYPSARVFF